jgi:hypothetical protein
MSIPEIIRQNAPLHATATAPRNARNTTYVQVYDNIYMLYLCIRCSISINKAGHHLPFLTPTACFLWDYNGTGRRGGMERRSRRRPRVGRKARKGPTTLKAGCGLSRLPMYGIPSGVRELRRRRGSTDPLLSSLSTLGGKSNSEY